jgi:hypothetical protein
MKRYFLSVFGMVIFLMSMSKASAAVERRSVADDITICNETRKALYLFVGESPDVFKESSELTLFDVEAVSVTARGTYLVCAINRPGDAGRETVAELTSVLNHEMWNVTYSPSSGLQIKLAPRSKRVAYLHVSRLP